MVNKLCEWCEPGTWYIKDITKVAVIEEDDGGELYFAGKVNLCFCPACGRELNPRPMTLEEAVEYGKPVWIDRMPMGFQQPPRGTWLSPDKVRERVRRKEQFLLRFWRTKPTPEQSEAFPWSE